MAEDDVAPSVTTLTRSAAGQRIHWVVALALPASLACFRGHFPAQPILAGVTQLQWAATLYKRCYEDPRSVSRVTRLKFMRVIRAREALSLRLEGQSGGDDFIFSYWVGAACCTTGRIHLRAAAPVRDSAGV